MLIVATIGNSYMLPKPGQDVEHLWVLITRPDPRTNQAVMVNLTTQQPHSDTTTILVKGEHPFIKRPSVIYYADAKIVPDATALDKAVAGKMWRQHDDFDQSLIARIQAGLMTSPFTPDKVRNAFLEAKKNGLDQF